MKPVGSLPSSQKAHHMSLSWARSIQSIPPHPTSWRYILILYSHLHPCLPSGLFLLRFPHQNSLYVSVVSHTRYMSRPSFCSTQHVQFDWSLWVPFDVPAPCPRGDGVGSRSSPLILFTAHVKNAWSCTYSPMYVLWHAQVTSRWQV